MEKDYSELVDFLGERFEKIDQKFEKIDQRFDKVDQRFKIVSQRFDMIDQRFDHLEKTKADKADVENLTNSVDHALKKMTDFDQELASFKSKTDRHEKWIGTIADKVEVKLEP